MSIPMWSVLAGDGDFGVICRYQDIDNFYGLEVSEDGYFSIWKYVDGEFSYDVGGRLALSAV